jgi:para-aminobenzoate synthetase/4-amino-4-deoxychorismate lyase
MRAVVLEEGDPMLDGPAREAVVTRAMLMRAEAVLAVNSLRGVMRASLRQAATASALYRW